VHHWQCDLQFLVMDKKVANHCSKTLVLSTGLHGVTTHNTLTVMNIVSKGRIYITNFFKQKRFNIKSKSLLKKLRKEFILFMSH